MSLFDRKFGAHLISSVPLCSGIYQFLDESGKIIYVGKSKNLRRRLEQYRNAKRVKKHRKMKTIIKHAHSLHIQPCHSEAEAELLEAQLIQKLRPRWNVAGAFYFLYPLIGLKVSGERFSICYSTQPDQFPEFEFHGAFRSRMLTRGAYESLTRLFDLIGHRCRSPKNELRPRYSMIQTYRQIPDHWYLSLSAFLKGETRDFLEELTLQLLENAGARRRSKEVEQEIRTILAFWQHEAQCLFRARTLVPEIPYPVSQTNRDLLFIRARHRLSSLKENTNTDRSQYLR